jgi:hypothetical protein
LQNKSRQAQKACRFFVYMALTIDFFSRENCNFLPVMVSEARNNPAKREREGESNPSRACLLDNAAPGSSTETASFSAATAFKTKCMEENSLKLHGKGQTFGMLRLALIPASPGTRAPLSMTSPKYFGKLRHYRHRSQLFAREAA